MKSFLIILYSLIFSCSSAQDCNKSSLIDRQIKQSLETDIYYFLHFKKEEIPLPKLFYSKEKIALNLKRFGVKSQEEVNNENIILNHIGTLKEESNYIVFNTGLIDNYIMLEIFFKREEYLNRPDKSEYETWRRYNAGISYLFQFDSKGCLIELKKHPISYG